MARELPVSSPVPEWPEPGTRESLDRFAQANRWQTLLHRCGLALRHRGWIVLLSLLLLGGAAGLSAGLRAPTYRAQATMWMMGRLSQVSTPDLSTYAYAEELTRLLATESDLLKSDGIQRRAYQHVLKQFPELRLPKLDWEKPVKLLPFKLTVTSVPSKSSVLNLTVVGPHPAATRAFLNAVMEAYVAFKREMRTQASGSALGSIAEQIHEVERHLREQQEKIDAFQRSNNVAYLSEQASNAGSHLAKLEAELSDARTEYQVLGLLSPQEAKALRNGQTLGFSELVLPGQKAAQELTPQLYASAQAYYQAVQQLQLLKAQRDQFARYLRPNHSKITRLDQDILGLEKLLRVLEKNDEEQTAQQLASVKKSLELQLQNLEAQHREWEANAVKASTRLAGFEPLKQEMQRSQALYDRLLNLVQTVDLNKELVQDSLRILEPASPALPTLTGLKLTLAGIGLALLVGVGLVFLVESFNDRFLSAHELGLQLPEAIIGQIPEISSTRQLPQLKPGQRNASEERNAFAESFRNLRSSLLFMYEPAHRPKVILLTSALPEEGKTTIAANLATTLAIGGSRVLLIDADLNRSSLHHTFQVSQGPGLREVLSRQCRLGEAMVAIPGASESSPEANKLFLLPAGDGTGSSSELFLDGQMDRLLQEVASQFDYVVIDTAPVLATDEASTLGPKTDGVFMVVRGLYTSAGTVREALERLAVRRVRILGLIYNRAEPRSDYFYQYHRNYSSNTARRRLPVLVAS